MGVDLHGMIEVRSQDPSDPWVGLEELEELYGGRSYDLFGCLFGVRNYGNFAPLFPDRGLPADLSKEALASMHDEYAEEGESPWWKDASWCTSAELAAIDHDELALRPDERVQEFEVVDGVEVYRSKSSWPDEWYHRPFHACLRWVPKVRIGSKVYRRTVLRRGDVLRDFAGVIERMAALAHEYGSDRVRLVVWFGS